MLRVEDSKEEASFLTLILLLSQLGRVLPRIHWVKRTLKRDTEYLRRLPYISPILHNIFSISNNILHVGEIQYVPINKNTGGDWLPSASSIFVNGKTTPDLNTTQIMPFDSGLSNFILPTELADVSP